VRQRPGLFSLWLSVATGAEEKPGGARQNIARQVVYIGEKVVSYGTFLFVRNLRHRHFVCLPNFERGSGDRRNFRKFAASTSRDMARPYAHDKPTEE
jgi:hypothetical protein